jgi:Ca2+:H+ antiporter
MRVTLDPRDLRRFAVSAVATAAGALTAAVDVGSVLPFVVSAVALALLAGLVGHAVDALGDRLGAGATGVLQSALGNLPELFVCLFALHAGLYDVVRAALVGSVLANVLLVLGLAFVVGGLRHGTQTFGKGQARTLSMLLALSVAAWIIPSLSASRQTPAAGHERNLSIVTSILLLTLFALSFPASLRRGDAESGGTPAPDAAEPAPAPDAAPGGRWPLWFAIVVLIAAGVAAAFVSDWFVAALTPAMSAVHISQQFAGLVVVAIAGNAVENVVGIQLAARNQADYALSVILQSPLQIALVLAPVLVLVAPLVGATFTLVLPPMLVVSLVLTVLLAVLVVNDGDSNWLEGASLMVLYALIAAAFWWG